MSDDKKPEQEKAAAEEIQKQKTSNEQAALKEKSNQQDRINQSQVNMQLTTQQGDSLNPHQQNSIQNIPNWMKNTAQGVTLKYETQGLAQGNEQGIISKLESLAHNNIIKGFDETKNGFKAFLQGGNQVNLDVDKSSVTLPTSLGQKVLDVATSLVSAAGGTGINISNIKNDDSRFMAWKSAGDNGLKVSGLKFDEEDTFKKGLDTLKGLTPKLLK